MDMAKQFTGFQTVIVYTIRKLLLSKRIYITLLILLFIVAVMAYASTLELAEEPLLNEAMLVVQGVDMLDALILFFFMPVMAMIYGSSLVRDEMDDRSITAVVTSPMERVVTYLGYYIGLAVSVSLIMLLILTAGFLAYYGNVDVDEIASKHDLDVTAMEIYGSFAALMVIGAFAYSALFIMVSVLLSKPIYFGLFYAFIWEGFIASIPGRMQLLSVKHYIRSLGSHWIEIGEISVYPRASSVEDAAWVLLIFSIATLILGAYLFREKEFT
ncbi:MAG: ABC transporter permease subunit [Thermoplasmata archaeon]|nr:MAG: ABC transporter permease subunit [Thermoplasmata archaeon]